MQKKFGCKGYTWTKKKYGKLNKKVLIMSLFVDEDLEKIDIFSSLTVIYFLVSSFKGILVPNMIASFYP